jgi:hypothetical protein
MRPARSVRSKNALQAHRTAEALIRHCRLASPGRPTDGAPALAGPEPERTSSGSRRRCISARRPRRGRPIGLGRQERRSWERTSTTRMTTGASVRLTCVVLAIPARRAVERSERWSGGRVPASRKRDPDGQGRRGHARGSHLREYGRQAPARLAKAGPGRARAERGRARGSHQLAGPRIGRRSGGDHNDTIWFRDFVGGTPRHALRNERLGFPAGGARGGDEPAGAPGRAATAW